jgi:hypothetical protein
VKTTFRAVVCASAAWGFGAAHAQGWTTGLWNRPEPAIPPSATAPVARDALAPGASELTTAKTSAKRTDPAKTASQQDLPTVRMLHEIKPRD